MNPVRGLVKVVSEDVFLGGSLGMCGGLSQSKNVVDRGVSVLLGGI